MILYVYPIMDQMMSGLVKSRILAYQTIFHGWIYMNLLLLRRELQAREEKEVFS